MRGKPRGIKPTCGFNSIPLGTFRKNRFHFCGAEDFDLLVGIESVEIATTGYDETKAFCQVDKIGNGAHSFVIRVMAF